MKRIVLLLLVVAAACATPTADQREREARIKARERRKKSAAQSFGSEQAEVLQRANMGGTPDSRSGPLQETCQVAATSERRGHHEDGEMIEKPTCPPATVCGVRPDY